MKNLIAFFLCLFYSPAFAQDLCKDVFALKNKVGLRPSTTLTYETIKVDQKLAFKDLKLEGDLKQVIPIADGKVSVLVTEIPYNRTDINLNPRQFLYVVEMSSKRIITSDTFTRIKHVSYLETQKLLAVDGTRTNDGKVAKLYLVPLTRSTPPVAFLTLPGSQYWGVDVKAVIERKDLSAIMVVQDSANALMTIRREKSNPFVDPYTSLLNQGVYLFDAKTLQPLSSLRYDVRQPVNVNLSPKSSLMAMTITNPIVADKNNLGVVIVDSRDPQKVIYQYDFKDSGITIPVGPNAEQKIGFKVSTHWSSDGRSLAIIEKSTGSVIVYDTVTSKETVSRREINDLWPILGGTFLENNQLLIIRQGLQPLSTKGDALDFYVYLMNIDALTSNAVIPSFPLQLSSVAATSQRSGRELNLNSIVEMQYGRVLALIFADQIILVDRRDARQQISLAPGLETPLEWWQPAKTLNSVEKINENTLRVSDHHQGVFDITVPEL
ncbi:MAG: hypothetical protein K2Q26_08310 [Bdellovibrionales bacterium]|nr:hypothetical protein [Bdellovibrionales bacterium]